MSDVYVTETPTEAVERVYREHGDRMWRALFAYSGDRELAADALAETFARLLRVGEQPRDPVAWAWRVAFRIAARELRERRRTTSEFADRVLEVEDERLDLVRALRRLSPKQRTCLVLHHYVGVPGQAGGGVDRFDDRRREGAPVRGSENGFARCWRYAMVDLDREFQALDQLDAPDVWAEVVGLDVGKPIDTAPPRRRGLTITFAFAVFAAAAVLVWNVFAPGTAQVGSPAGWQTYPDPAGWSMRYPGAWHMTTFRDVCMAGFSGAMVSNVPDAYHSTVTADGCYWPPNMASLPSDGVVVEFDLMQGGPATGPLSGPSIPPDTSFPLSLDALQPAPTPGTDVGWYTQRVQVGGDPHYTLNVWIGAGATERAREIANSIVASIAFAAQNNSQIAVPNVVGLSAETARKMLSGAGLEVRTEIVPGTYDDAAIIEQTPSAGSRVDSRSRVTIVIGPAAHVAETASDVLHVTCQADGTATVQSATVQAQADGLHVVVVDQAGAKAVVFTQPSRPSLAWSSGSNGLDGEFVSLVAPGETIARCEQAGTTYDTSKVDPGAATFVVLDPNAYWTSADLACGPLDDSWAMDVQPVDPLVTTIYDAARMAAPGISDTDLVESAGYIVSRADAGLVRVVRDGQVIAWLRDAFADGWAFDGYACPGSGIGGQ